MSQIRRGSTPTQPLTLDTDIHDYKCIVTLQQEHRKIDLEGERLTVELVQEEDEPDKTRITFTLTQAETLSLREGVVKVQVRAVKGADAVVSEGGKIEVLGVLRDGEIHDD